MHTRAFQAMAVIASVTVVTAQRIDAVTLDPIGAVHELIRVFFPELANQNNKMLVYAVGSFDRRWSMNSVHEFGLEVVPPSERFLQHIGSDAGRGLLNAACEFDDSGELQYVSFAGMANRYAELVKLRELVDSNRTWSDDAVVQALVDAGAAFGPRRREAFVAALPPMKALAPVLGATPTVATVEFNMRDDVDFPRNANLVWEVLLKVQVPGERRQRQYIGRFEPLSGKLESLDRVPPSNP